MIQKYYTSLVKIYQKIISSIAFYPTVISVMFFGFALIILSIEDNKMTKFLIDNLPFLVINNAETARSVLNTLIGGIISLTVFSFSMVMVLLNQASSSFSPRLLPGLISDKKNQIVLGIYIGTIIYNILVVISILPDGDSYTLNGFSVLLGIVFGIISLSLFVFFIHSISTNIQINNILESIFLRTKSRLKYLIEKDTGNGQSSIWDNDNCCEINVEEFGYFQGVQLKKLLSIADELEVNIRCNRYKGETLLTNMNLFSVDKNLNDDEIRTILDKVIVSQFLNYENNYLLGFKQITEVGIKAMSPGINDPGTALMTLDYLGELLAIRMGLDDFEIYTTPSKNYKVELAVANFYDILDKCFAAFRQYCKHDVILMEKIISILNFLLKQDSKYPKYKKAIKDQLESLEVDIAEAITNKNDLNKLTLLINTGIPN